MLDHPKIAAAYLFAIPLALILGILAASPGEVTFMLVGLLLFFLSLPLLIKWHHAWLIIFWNSAFIAFFLPGSPNFWLVLAAISFGLSVLNYVMGRHRLLSVPEMTWPLIALAGVVIATALYRGGIGFRILGGAANGGRFYVLVLGAIVGYFALTAVSIPIFKSQRMTSLFFLSGTSYALANLVYVLGPLFFFFYYLVPSGGAMGQAAADYGLTPIDRIQGLSQACPAVLCFLLIRYGVRGLFDPAKPWRLAFLVLTVVGSLFAGYRSILALLFLIFAFQFLLEGLLRTRLFLVLLGIGAFSFVTLLLFASKMPLSVQRTVSFLPVNVDASVRADAAGSTDWRVQMWSVVWKEVPKYLVIGKGYSIDPTDMYLTVQAIRMDLLNSFEESMLAGDYHNGPLSILVPFGIAGVLAFAWVLIAGGWVLCSNYRYGDAKLRRINSVLLAYYLSCVVCFFFIFGAFNTQLFLFLGVVGLSVSLNGSVKRKPKPVPERVRAPLPQAYAVELG